MEKGGEVVLLGMKVGENASGDEGFGRNEV